MKRNLLFILITILITNFSNGQNLLSPIWKYTKVGDFKEVESLKYNNWPEVNLLLSWERQGLCWIDNNLVLRNEFFVNEKDTSLQLEFSLQGDIHAVYINRKQVTGNINNSFWSNRGKKEFIQIPDSILKRNRKNEITILISNPSYTGGVSHNFCSIHPINAGYEDKLSIDIPQSNHIYLADDNKQFTIKSHSIKDRKIQIMINNDFHQTLVNEFIDLKKGNQEYVFQFKKRNFKPGLYECVVIGQGETFCSTVEWFGVQPEKISCPIQKKSGFDKYWQDALNELKEIEPNYKIRKVDSLCSPTRNGYIIEMNSLGNLTIRGYYFVPKTGGKHPAILHLPGYGYGFEDLKKFVDRKSDCAELALCVRGHGISKDFFNPWDKMTLWAVNICDKDKYVYRSIYMDCVRAVDFLINQTEIDKNRIGVAGGSQGGGLALATAALCNSNIAACAIFDPWLCDIRDQTKIRTTVNKELDLFKTYPTNNCDIEQMLSVLDYMDTKEFAPNIKCPVYFLTSLFDDDCPPHCGFAAYNNLKTKKEYLVFPKDSHLGESGQFDNLFYIAEKMLAK